MRIQEKDLQSFSCISAILAAGLVLLSGCRADQGASGMGPAGHTAAGAGVTADAAPSNRAKTGGAAQAAGTTTTNRSAAAVEPTQAELIQKLITRIEELEKKVAEQGAAARAAEPGQDLDQKIRILERNNELAKEAAEARAKEQPRLTVGPSGFALSSADTNFVLKFKGLVQLDSRTFFEDNPLLEGNDSFLLRRARPIIEGTVFRDFDFQFVPDFGGSSVQIFDAWMNYRYRPELQLKAGKFKGPVGLENLQSDATLPFNERGLVSNFVPTRNVGVSLWGDIAGGLLSYSAGAFNVAGDGRNASTSDFGDDKEFGGRAFVFPFHKTSVAGLREFGFGLGGSYSQVDSNANGLPNTSGGTRPGYITSGAQQFFAYNPVAGTVVADGGQWRISPQFTYAWGPFGLLGEYGISHHSVVNSATPGQSELDHTSWQVVGQWVLTGEAASFTGINPKRAFRPGSGWGAWQVVGRFGQLEIDDDTFPTFSNPATSARRATAWAVGLNWWLNRNVRVMTSFSHTDFAGGGAFNPADATTLVAPATVTAQDENAFFTRLQLSF